MKEIVRTGNALLILVLVSVIGAAFFQEATKQGPPCPLCLLQRIGMIGIATGALMNLRFGIRTQHYALSLLSAGIGGAVSIRQILLHVCPGFPEFGYPVLGYGLYTWAFIVFCCSALAIIIFMLLYKPDQAPKMKMNWLEKCAFFALVLITIANIGISFSICGLHFCPDPPWPPVP